MLFTFNDAYEFCKDHIKHGTCSEDEAKKVINEATMILLNEGNWKNTVRRMRIRTSNNMLPCPAWVETVLKVNFCTKVANVWNMTYEFLSGGPGTLDYGNNTLCSDLVDMGSHFPTFFPIGPFGEVWEGMNLLALSEAQADIGKQILVRGLKDRKQEVQTSNFSVMGEMVPICQWQGGVEGTIDHETAVNNVSSNKFYDITHVSKPVTSGYITLIGYDTSNYQIVFLAKYLPEEIQPCYRWYRITGKSNMEDTVAECLVKLGYTPIVNNTDVLLIQNLPALKLMCKSIYQYDHGDKEEGRIMKHTALGLLNKELANTKPARNEFDYQISESFTPPEVNKFI